MNFLEKAGTFIFDHWRNGFEIVLLACLIYYIFKSIRGTRGGRIFTGIALILVILFFISQILRLEVINFLLKSVTLVFLFSLIVIFQPELRRMLAQIGGSGFFGLTDEKTNLVDIIMETTEIMSGMRHGALIAIEKETNLDEYAQSGVELDCRLTGETLRAIFFPKSPLHDGGVILRGNRIIAAACIFPVSESELNDRSIGLRHRAGLGICEESDCAVMIVSEETGNKTLCIDGAMLRNLSNKEIKKKLTEFTTGKND